MLDALISNKTRIKLLTRFFLNPESRAYLRGLGRELSENSNALRIELNRFEDAGLIISERSGNKKFYKANTKYPLFSELQNIAIKQFGLDQVIEKVVNKLGHVKKVYLIGQMANGRDSAIVDIALIGNKIDKIYLTKLTEKAEKLIARKIRCLVLNENEINKVPEPKMLLFEV